MSTTSDRLSATDRRRAAASALGSVRAEGLNPGRAEQILDAWARGALSDAQLDEAKRRVAAGEPVDDLLASAS